MKIWKVISVLLVTGAAICLMAGVVAAAPASTNGVQANQVHDDPIMTGTVPVTQPVAAAIASYFHISYTEVISLHEAGYGFGVIARAYLTALRSNGVLTPTQLLDMFNSGMGWGQIKNEYGLHPGGNGLGTIMRQHGTLPSTAQPPSVPPASDHKGKADQGGNSGPATCPGNSCNAPGHTKGQGPKK
jgi:hypothetical protein